MPAKHHGADKHRESPEHVHRLRTAVAIGREQRSQWPELQRALSAATAKSCAGTHPVVDLGIITAPFNVDRRRRVRRARDVLLTRGDACSVVLTFLLGELSMFTAKERAAITAEQQKHDDLLLLRAHDGVAASAAAHGGRAVAEKALAWYIHSATHTRADYVAKVDDDSMVNLPRLVAELRAVTATAPRPEHAHFGVHVYRVWNWGRQAKVPNAACGEHSDNGPPAGRGVLRQMNASVKEGGKCAGAMGPFPFLDGSFEVLGKGVLTTIFGAARVRAFASTEFERPRPPYWSHEDAGLGALIHREVSERNLPMTYVALRRWQHNRFWLNWADLSTLVDGDVLWSHYTRSAERSDYVGGAFASMAQLPSDGLSCGDCLTEWGWPAASSASTCCTKPKPAHRLAVTRSLRKRFANEAEINRTCGFDRTETQREDGRKTRLPRQPRGRFDAAARSKLLDQFMEKPRLGRSQNVDRTEPVPWCKTGGVVTHVAAPRKKASRVHSELVKDIDAAKKAFVRDLAQNMSNHRQGIRDLEDDERRVKRGGAAAKGRYALDRVLDFIAEEEALKERQEKARLEAEALRR